MKIKLVLLSSLIILSFLKGYTQEAERFQSEVDKLIAIEHTVGDSDRVLLFTGSSSIRMWKTLQDYFEGYYTINNGFGGSHMSDLLFYSEDLVHVFNPEMIFIYEGDNDIAAGKNKKEIAKSTKRLLKEIKKKHPGTTVVLIAAKPSPLRWDFKKEYEDLNAYFEKLASRKKNIYYADVWDPMLDDKGMVIKELFIEDDLHMNEDGYIIWGKVLNDLLKNINE